MTATLTIQGDDRLLKALSHLEKGKSKHELFDTLGSYGVSSTQQRFLDQKDPDGETWKATKRGGDILRKDDRLFNSLDYKASENSAEWGTNVIYAAIHQFGGIIKAKAGKKLAFMGLKGMVFLDQVTIPARPYLGINEEDRSEMVNLVEDWMRRPFEA